MTDSVNIEFTGNTYLLSSQKETFPSTFKTASEIIKEERLRLSILDKDKKAHSLELSAHNNAQRSTPKNDKLQMQMSGFVCARKIHEGNMINSSTSSSKSKIRRSKTVKRVAKTVYEQILAQSSKKTMEERKDVSHKTELKIDNVNSIKTKNEIKSESKNKRGYEYVECHENDIKSAKKKRIVHDDYVDKTSNNISDKNNDKKILNDKIMKMIRRSTDTVINTTNDNLSRTQEKHFEIKTNVELKRKEETTHLSHSKSHKNSSNRPKVPADKATQFKTAEILKSYLMKYYPSERLPDRATFTKTCREMHYNMLHKKIFGTISLKVYNIILLNVSNFRTFAIYK